MKAKENFTLAKQSLPVPLQTGHSPGPCAGSYHLTCPPFFGKCCWTCSPHSKSWTRWVPTSLPMPAVQRRYWVPPTWTSRLQPQWQHWPASPHNPADPHPLPNCCLSSPSWVQKLGRKYVSACHHTAVTLSRIWKERTTSSKVRAYQVRSELEQTINLICTTRLANASEDPQTMIDQMFH